MLVTSHYLLFLSHFRQRLLREKRYSRIVFERLELDGRKVHLLYGFDGAVNTTASTLAKIKEQHRLGQSLVARTGRKVKKSVERAVFSSKEIPIDLAINICTCFGDILRVWPPER